MQFGANMSAIPRGLLLTLLTAIISSWAQSCCVAQTRHSRFATSDSRADYVHRITLYDSRNRVIVPGKNTAPYSPSRTCGRCHDVEYISSGYHFNPDEKIQQHGRPGEPWVWVDPMTGTQLPLSYRPWPNSYQPEEMGISAWDFILHFGSRMCGGYPSPEKVPQQSDGEGEQGNRFRWSGPLEVDCMVCHARGNTFDIEAWAMQIDSENFAWAPTAAIGLAVIDGAVKKLPEDFDPATEDAEDKLPKVQYDESLFDADGQVFFDIVSWPPDNACYRCHSNLAVGEDVAPRWTHDQDVHLAAGLRCVDCHRNGLGHDTVRGFEGEVHPQQEHVVNLSCRGCHLRSDTDTAYTSAGGRLGAPYPEHRGLPPVHLERLSCTACHAGPLPSADSGLVQTARNHLLGHKAHRKVHQQPEIVQPVLLAMENGVLAPHRVVWPSYWGTRHANQIVPLKPSEAQELLRLVLRVRRDFFEETMRVRLSRAQKADVLGDDRAMVPTSQLTDTERAKLAQLEQAEGLKAFREKINAGLLKLKETHAEEKPAFVAGGKVYQLDAEKRLEVINNPQAQPYAWAIGHDVRPARWALGARGCTDCHSDDAPFIHERVTAQAPVPDSELATRPMYEYANLDPTLMSTWARSFQGRTAFKWVLVVSVTCLAGVLLIGGTAWLAVRIIARRNSNSS